MRKLGDDGVRYGKRDPWRKAMMNMHFYCLNIYERWDDEGINAAFEYMWERIAYEMGKDAP